MSQVGNARASGLFQAGRRGNNNNKHSPVFDVKEYQFDLLPQDQELESDQGEQQAQVLVSRLHQQ